MKSFTKLYVLVLALLFSVGMVAQNDAAIQYEQQQIESQRWLGQHGPTIEVPPPSSREVTAAGDDCSEPILITLSKGMSVVNADGTTCGAGNDYSNSCMGLYDGGEDTHYELNVTEPMWVLINFDPVETYSGIAIKDQCGDGGTCLVIKGEYSNAAKQIKYEFTAAGTYYLMIDTWPSPPCVTYTMDFQEYIPPPPAEPIVSFPFEADFDDCGDIPAEMQALTGDRNSYS